eukprot:contig_32787_g7947
MARKPAQAAVRVLARVRPHFDGEGSVEGATLVADPGAASIRLAGLPPASRRGWAEAYNLDGVFDAAASQADVYDGAVAHLVAGVLGGAPATVFTFGPSGSGKTHTLLGGLAGAACRGVEAASAGDPVKAWPAAGVAVRVAADLLTAVQTEGAGRTIRASIVELFWLFDLVGGEGLGDSEACGVQEAETKANNRDLHALGLVFAALRRPGYVPFRNSSVTSLLQAALLRGGRAVMVACVSLAAPLSALKSTLRRAEDARGARARPRV